MATEDISDWIAGKAAEDERFRDRVAETLNLYGLTESEGWSALKAHFERGTDGFAKSLAQRQLGGEQVNQREIDYLRGFLDAAKAIFTFPDQALAHLETSARRGWAAHVSKEIASAIENESLYIQGPQEVA